METNKICPNCRKPLPPDVPLGLCPECLIKSGFPTEGGGGAGGEAAGARFVPPPVEEITRLFPQLEILGLIGKGGMGAVYKARQPALDRFVALKVLPPAVGSDPGFAERFNREARALARLNHPNIVAVHDFGKAGPLHYLVMEFVDGTNLREVEHAGRLTPEQALSIVPQICEALQFAHNEGIVHRDIKPENLLMDKKGRVKITDFGIAKIVGQPGGKVSLTGAKDVVGTPHYMAPEQIEQPQMVDHRADIYSLGVVFYEMLTGELPLGKFAPPSRKVQMDVRLDEVVLHTLEKEPARRYQHVSQVKTDVETITGTLPPGTGFAGQAGAAPSAFPGAAAKTTSDKALLPALLLAFPFGLFGAHRFYVGKFGTAAAQSGAFIGCILMIIACATTGSHLQPTLGILLGFSIFGCFTWVIIDWILILCKAFTDGQGRRMTHWLHPQNGDLKTGASPITGPPSGLPPRGAAAPASAGPTPLPPAKVSPPSRTSRWPWILTAIGATGVIVVGLTVATLLALWHHDGKPNLTVHGTVTDAATGKPIAGARVDDNRYGTGTDKAPQQAWTDAEGRYELNTWYEEHDIAASANGYETRLALLRTKPFGREHEKWMDFQLLPVNAKRSGSHVVEGKIVIDGRLITDKAQLEDDLKGGTMVALTGPKLDYATTSAPPLRIKAGLSKPLTDSDGNFWLPDHGFADGKTLERSQQMEIANTKDPALYRTERYGMTSFSYPVPNGDYLVKLHFAETFNGIKGPGLRVFTFIVEGQEFKDFDIWVKAGGPQRAYIETVKAKVTDGRLNINFIRQQENPEINGIEILPVPPAPAAPPTTNAAMTTTTAGAPATQSELYAHREKIVDNILTRDEIRQDFTRILPLTADGRVSLENVNGHTEISGWDRNEVAIQAVKHGKPGERIEATQIEVNAQSDRISIRAKQSSSRSGAKGDEVDVDYTVRVPRNARLATISNVNGQIRINGVAGDIEASNVNGETQVAGAAGNLKLSTANGRIEAELVSLGRDQTVSFKSVNGRIGITLPARADADVTASSVSGDIHSEFSALTVKKNFPLGGDLKGTLGQGGARVKATTVNGGIHFRRGKDAR
jgi:serine/threonine protein kinase